MMALKASTTASEREPWTYWQFRQPSQFAKKPPLHMHCWWARYPRGEVLLGWHCSSMLTMAVQGGIGEVVLGVQTEAM